MRIRLSRPTWGHLAALVALWALFFWRFAAPDPQDRWALADGDFTQQFGVFRNLVYSALAAGRFPLWADCLLSGYPLHADPQTQLFYPPAWVTYAALRLGGWGHYPIEALTAEAIAHYLLTSLFLYAFLRGEVRRPAAALFGAVVFTYSGYLTGFPVLQTATIETLTWLPLALLCLRNLTATRRFAYLAGGALTLAVAFFGGHPQTFVYVAGVALAYLVFRARGYGLPGGRILAWAGGLVGLTALLAAVQLLPSLQFIALSTRASLRFDEAAHGFPFQDILQFLLTGVVSHWQPLYIGVLPLALALFGALAHRDSASRFWAGIGLGALMLSFGGKAAAYDVAYWLLPGFRLFRGQEHFSLVVAYAFATLAAYGADTFLGPLTRRGRRLLRGLESAAINLVILSLVLLAGGVIVARAGFDRSDSGQLPARVAILALFAVLTALLVYSRRAWPASRRWWGAAALLVSALDLFAVNRGVDVTSPFEAYPYSPLIEPIRSDGGFFRVQDDSQLKGHSGCGYGFRQVDGITPYRLGTYQDFLDKAPEPVRWQLLGVKYVVTWRQALAGPPDSEAVAEAASAPGAPNAAGITKVYRLDIAPRRAFLVRDVRLAAGDEALALLNESGFNAYSTAAANTTVRVSSEQAAGSADDAVEVLRDVPGELALRVRSAVGGVLVVSEAYFPGWQASIGGELAPVLLVDGALQGVAVDAGEHEVRLQYRPRVLLLGAIISLVGLVAAAVGVLRKSQV